MAITHIALVRRGWVAGILLLSGCANVPDGSGRVGADLRERTDFPIAPGTPAAPAVPEGVVPDDGLDEEEAVRTALWNNAQLLDTLADLGLSRADVVQAAMIPNPTLGVLFPVGVKPLELVARYPLEFLWLRPKRTAAAKLEHERTEQRLVQAGIDLIRDVRVAFADAALANSRTRLAESAEALAREFSDLSAARNRAGDASELEAEAASVDVLQARELGSRLRIDEAVTRERLHLLLGLGPTKPPELKLESPELSSVAPDADTLLAEALAGRPDQRSAGLALEAAGKRIGLARAEAFLLAVSINAKDINGEVLTGPGLDVTIPIFNRNEGGVAQAQARFEKAARQFVTNRNRIVLEVREARLRLTQAGQSVRQWREEILPPLEAAVRHAESAFAAGNAGYQIVLENRRRLLDAEVRAAAARADLRRAWAELERGVGRRISRRSVIHTANTDETR